jgi:hypothetical protein
MKKFFRGHLKIPGVLILAIFLALGWGGCGKKGPPVPKYPFGGHDTYYKTPVPDKT